MSGGIPSRPRDSLPIRVFPLGEEPGEDLSGTTTPEERLEMVALLTERLWHLSGLPTPKYPRAELPGRLLRRE